MIPSKEVLGSVVATTRPRGLPAGLLVGFFEGPQVPGLTWLVGLERVQPGIGLFSPRIGFLKGRFRGVPDLESLVSGSIWGILAS